MNEEAHERQHIAAVLAQYRLGFATAEHYYTRVLAQFVGHNSMTISDLVIDIAGDLAYAFCCFHFEGQVTGHDAPRIADGRTTFVLHRKAAMWRVIHYHESRRGSF